MEQELNDTQIRKKLKRRRVWYFASQVLKVIPFIVLYWMIEYHDHPPPIDREHGHPIYIHDTIYIDRVIYDTLFVIDDGSGDGYLSDHP